MTIDPPLGQVVKDDDLIQLPVVAGQVDEGTLKPLGQNVGARK